MKKSIAPKTAERLSLTEEGRVLLNLIESHGSPSMLAARLKVDPQSVRHWLYVGSIPKSAAIAAAPILKVKREDLRPDLPADAWKPKVVEKPVREPIARTEDAKLLVSLADKFGGVKELCAAAMCTSAEFHTWKTRGRIPAIKLPTFLALK
jgi:DNA-binding transcriptional regulator YdaS (Cro superfamily)